MPESQDGVSCVPRTRRWMNVSRHSAHSFKRVEESSVRVCGCVTRCEAAREGTWEEERGFAEGCLEVLWGERG